MTGVVEAGCGGSETLHAPFGEAVADAEPMTSPAPLPRTSARIATVTLAPGADQPLRKHPRFAYSSIHNMDTLHIKHYIIILYGHFVYKALKLILRTRCIQSTI